eukprot:TRINITY_DN2655_c0_g1_i2.p1 TRINITY_DN2655_c0_g1~~TRINITY_DN2655_c0_g1_i2.p1  ORF type:complete len:508 (+),score=64.53 TRINITY_DN2655_c0_g1_i2:152-1525(+)
MQTVKQSKQPCYCTTKIQLGRFSNQRHNVQQFKPVFCQNNKQTVEAINVQNAQENGSAVVNASDGDVQKWISGEQLEQSELIVKEQNFEVGRQHTFQEGPIMYVTKPLPSVLVVHTGGTLGMDPGQSYENDDEGLHLKRGTGGTYKGSLMPGDLLSNLKEVVPEMSVFGNLDLKVAFNKDSSRVGPQEWIQLAKLLDANRNYYDAFMVIHGTDTMAYTASALSLMLLGFKKPIIVTGSQLPLSMPRSDARQNLIDSITCATAYFNPPHVELQEVAVCFGGKLMRGNRSQKVNSSYYAAFDSPSYPHLANLGVDVEWNTRFLLRPQGTYRPRFKLVPNVIRIPIVPGCEPMQAYGDLVGRGIKGVVLEAFGVGNMPDEETAGWLPWLGDQRSKGLQVYLASQCTNGPLHPELYHSGSVALALGVEAGPQMSPECAVVKMMLCLAHPDIPLGVPLAGEM